MKEENKFYLLIVGTIFIIRISIMIVPNVDITIFNNVIHHFWWGIALLVTGFIIPENKKSLKIVFYGIGLGLVIDQLVFMILGGGGDTEYWSLPSLGGAVVGAIILYLRRKEVLRFLLTRLRVTSS